MSRYNYKVSGKVIDRRTKRAIPGLRIQVWHEKFKILGESVTDRMGQFTTHLSLAVIGERLKKNLEKQLKKNLEERLIKKDKNPIREREILLQLEKELKVELKKDLKNQLEKVLSDLKITVYHNDQQLESVKYQMDWDHPKQMGNIHITMDVSEIDLPEEDSQDNDDEQQQFHVDGYISKVDKTPISNVIVRAYHKQLRTEKQLGEARSREDGRYEIDSKVPDGAVHLLIRVFDQDGTELAESAVLFHATLNENVDIVISSENIKVASEFEKIQQYITPHLNGIEPATLSDEEVSYLGQETDLSIEQIKHYILAHRLHQNTSAPLEVLYGTLRIEKPTSLTDFLVKDSDVHDKAIQEAMKSNVISKEQDENSLINQLDNYTVKRILETPEEGIGPSIGSLMKHTQMSSEQQFEFLHRYVEYKEDSASFWRHLREDKDFGEEAIDDLQMTMKIDTITAGHLPLTQRLKKQYETGQLTTLQDLSRLSQDDWLQMMEESVEGDHGIEMSVPEGIEGDNEEEKRLIYAKVLTRTIEDAYPTAVFTEHLRQDAKRLPLHEGLLDVLDENKDFELHETPVAQLMKRDPERFKNNKHSKTLIEQLKSTRRAFLLAPRFERYTTVKALQENKLDSATTIASLDQETFVRSHQAKLGGEARAQTIHRNALKRAGMVQTLITNQGTQYHQLNTSVVPGPEIALAKGPELEIAGIDPEIMERLTTVFSDARATWKDLFGRMDYCDCEHCRSAYSPAAYLTDLLHFLKDRPASEVGRALETLDERRPDIRQMLLNCENTNTPLPYIDLVNEVLEYQVLQLLDQEDILDQEGIDSRNTTLMAEELRAYPEHIQTAAYAKLSKVVYPWSLPFHLYAQEARLYLNHLGIDRYRLMMLLQTDQNNNDIHSGSPSFVEIACERLGILSVEHRLVTGTHEQSNTPWELWDFSTRSNWTQTLRGNIPELLARAQLTFKELLALLRTDYINPKGLFGIRFSGVDGDDEDSSRQEDLCNLDHAWFDNRNGSDQTDHLFANFLDRLHRFVRLQRVLKWTAHDLDITIRTLGEGEDPFNETDNYSFIVRVAHIAALQREWKLPLEEILSWYGNINTLDGQTEDNNNKALYGQLFLNYTVTQPINDDFTLSDTGQRIGDSTDKADHLSEYAETIQAALRISASDFDQLQSYVIDSGTLTLENLSALHRHVSLARALDVSIPDFLVYMELIHRHPFDRKDIQGTKDFIDHVEEVKNSTFSLTDLNGLLRHSGTSDLLDLDVEITDTLHKVQEGLNEIYREHRIAVEAAISELKDTDKEEDPESLLKEKERLLSLCQKQSKRLVKETLAGMLQVDPLVGEALIAHMETSPTSLFIHQAILESDLTMSCETLLDEVDNIDTVSGNSLEINRVNFATLYDGIVRLKKAAHVVRKMKITKTDIPKVFTWSEQGHWLDLNQLPTKASTKPMFKKWLNLKYVMKQQQKQTQSKKLDFLDLLQLTYPIQAEENDDSTRTEFLHHLSGYYDWDEEALTDLVGPTGLDLSMEELGHVDEIERLTQIMSMLDRASVSVEGLMSLKTADVTKDVAQTARFAAKAKHEAKAWLNIAEPIRNIVREQQRTALVDYIVSRMPDIQTSNDLLGHLLIDVEMSSCKETSRITQAISSVQLFVQRCLMNLEDIHLSPADAKEWKQWRKRYRIWEVNRKIFLYPENWIDPDLRTNKSPFFKELEENLMQQDVTTEAVEQAYRHYIAKLTEVANLEMAGLCEEKDEETGKEIVHIFARTRSIPHIYYYRQRVDDTYWTAWDKLDLEIEGDHLIPMVLNRRLTLLWPIFTEKVVEEVPDDDADSSEKEAKKYWEIKMAWSNYQDGEWSAKQTTNEGIRTYNQSFPKKSIYFSVEIKKNEQKILCIGNDVDDLDQDKVNGIFYFDYCNNQLTAESNIKTYEKRNYPWEDSPMWSHHWMGRVNEGSSFHLHYPSYPLDGSTIYKEWQKIDEKLLKKKSDYLFLPSPRYNNGKYVIGMFLVVDQKANRTFFIKPDKWVWSRGLGDVLAERKDIDLDKYRVANNLNRIPVQVHWDDLIAGHQFLEQFQNLTDPNHTLRILGMTDEQGSTGTIEMFARSVQHDASPSASMEIEESFHSEGIEVATMEDFFQPPVSYDKKQWNGQEFEFQTFYHPQVCTFNENLIRYGVEGLLDPDQANPLYRQQLANDFNFEDYQPSDLVSDHLPVANVDFTSDGAYSIYNWELFFHIPFLTATRLSQNQRFEDAQKWFHYIFDPTTPPTERENTGYGRSSARRFWKIKPFYDEEARRLQEMLVLINQYDEVAGETGDSSQSEKLESYIKQIEQWESNPFDPHTIAQLRPVAYMKAVVMKYIDNLIAWGDQLFQQATRESIDEATHLYVLASQILGERPQSIPGREVPALSFANIEDNDDLGPLSNVEVEVEDWLPDLPTSVGRRNNTSLPIGKMLFYCIPKNEKLMGYWRTVEDRLFKIRHCMNIEGQVQQLPLFAPPIDPSLLVSAAASGADISRAVSDLQTPLPHYRYQVLSQKAVELCQTVKGLGGSLLSALEKQDGEKLLQLKATQQVQLQEAILQIRTQQIEEAEEAVEGLERSRAVVEERRDFYANRDRWNGWESTHLSLVGAGATLRGVSQLMMLGAAPLEALPNINIGVSGAFASPVATSVVAGGEKAANAVKDVSTSLSVAGSLLETGGQMASVVGGYHRRWEEWDFQKNQAEKEMERIDKQVDEANIRLAIVEQEKKNMKLQIEQAKEEEDYLTDKYTNDQLYNWMVTQISNLYFQSYELAYSVAKSAEKAYQFELGRYHDTFITFGHWDNLHRGLLSGERLHHELQRMDVAYLNNDRREYELTKDVSLLQLDPYELIRLKETGACEIRLPETLFDQDYPGHYMRRIKTVSITIPCVSGPYTSVNATLTLVQSSTRTSTDTQNEAFHESLGAYHTMATSHASRDAGMFELNFRDDRYLPFEGAGAASTWYLELPKDTNHLDFSTISDVLLHLSYTSRDGGPGLKDFATERRNNFFANEGLTVTYSAKQNLSAAWHEFLEHPNPETRDHEMHVEILAEGFPASSGHHIQFDTGQDVVFLMKINEQALRDGQKIEAIKLHVGEKEVPLQVGGHSQAASLVEVDNIFSGQVDASEINAKDWVISLKTTDIPKALKRSDESGQGNLLRKDLIEDVWIICHYALEDAES